MPSLKRKIIDVEESKMGTKKLRRSSFGLHQAVNFNAKYLRTRDSNIHLIPHGHEHGDSDISLSSETKAQSRNHGHRVKSIDLVEHLFGSLVSVRVATVVLLAFLKLNLVQTRSQHDDIPHPVSTEDQIDACLHAAAALHNKLYQKGIEGIHNLYRWEWSPHLSTHTGAGAALFLNVVAAIAHQVMSSVSVSSGFANTPMRTFWTTVPNPNPPVRENEDQPSSSSHDSSNGSNEQDSDPHPSIVAVPIEAFTTTGPSNDAERPSIFSKLNTILSDTPTSSFSNPTCSSRTSFSSGDNPSITYREGSRHPSVFSTVQSIFTDLPINTPPTSTETSPSTASSIHGLEHDIDVEDFRTFLHSQAELLSINLNDFSHLRHDQVKPEFLCFEGFAATGKLENVNVQDSPSSYVSRVLPYMQRQYIAQPHLHFVLGLVMEGDTMTLCRGDSMGTEECTFDINTGSGVLEIIRLALGFAVADNKTLGHDPDFELERAFGRSLVGTGANTEQGIDTEGMVFVPKYYNTPPDSTGRLQRYYLHYLVDNRGSFGGRMTRVWCAYRQVKTEEDIMELVHDDDQNEAREIVLRKDKDIFVGPYALKYQNIDASSKTSKESVVRRIREAVEEERNVMKKNELRTGVECILLPQHTYSGTNLLCRRGIAEDRGVPDALARLAPKQSVITISLFKRTLSQYKNFEEVARAIADGLRAIHWLHQKGFLHRDISDGNLLLSSENPTAFEAPFSPASKVVLCRRKVSSPKGVYGLVHDFDLVGLVHVDKAAFNDQSETCQSNHQNWEDRSQSDDWNWEDGSQSDDRNWEDGSHSDDQSWENSRSDSQVRSQTKGWNNPIRQCSQIGTPAYMSIRVLKNTLDYHTVADDVESLFYVLYLFPFSNKAPQASASYPHAVPIAQDMPKWTGRIKEWTTGGIDTTLRQLGSMKNDFFVGYKSYNDPVLEEHMYFKDHGKRGRKERTLWGDLVNILHNEYLFSSNGLNGSIYRNPSMVEGSIREMIKDLDKRIRAKSSAGASLGRKGRKHL